MAAEDAGAAEAQRHADLATAGRRAPRPRSPRARGRDEARRRSRRGGPADRGLAAAAAQGRKRTSAGSRTASSSCSATSRSRRRSSSAPRRASRGTRPRPRPRPPSRRRRSWPAAWPRTRAAPPRSRAARNRWPRRRSSSASATTAPRSSSRSRPRTPRRGRPRKHRADRRGAPHGLIRMAGRARARHPAALIGGPEGCVLCSPKIRWCTATSPRATPEAGGFVPLPRPSRCRPWPLAPAAQVPAGDLEKLPPTPGELRLAPEVEAVLRVRTSLDVGSGARAYGMGGAFLARADDATAASWNPAGLSYLRRPELSLVGARNSFSSEEFRPATEFVETETGVGRIADFVAATYPVSLGPVSGAAQVSYQRVINFTTDRIAENPDIIRTGESTGGFDVVALGTGFRVFNSLRVGGTLNRWFNGYTQTFIREPLVGRTRGRVDQVLRVRALGMERQRRRDLGALREPEPRGRRQDAVHRRRAASGASARTSSPSGSAFTRNSSSERRRAARPAGRDRRRRLLAAGRPAHAVGGLHAHVLVAGALSATSSPWPRPRTGRSRPPGGQRRLLPAAAVSDLHRQGVRRASRSGPASSTC